MAAALHSENNFKSIQFLNIKGCAQALGVSTRTWRRWVDANLAPKPVRVGPTSVRWRVADIEAWLEARSADQLQSGGTA